MKNSQLNRVIKLMRRTGDRVVIMDNESEEVVVLLDMDNYEKLLSGERRVEELSEEELLEKINREVGLWREHNDDSEFDTGEVLSEEVLKPEPAGHPTGEVPEKLIPLQPAHEEAVSEPEPADDLPEEEEEKFYLEPVE